MRMKKLPNIFYPLNLIDRYDNKQKDKDVRDTFNNMKFIVILAIGEKIIRSK